jgi:hypothetical protein
LWERLLASIVADGKPPPKKKTWLAWKKEAIMTRFKYTRLAKNDAVCLLVDHQSGLISLVQDFSPGEFKNNVLALAASAKYFELPTIGRTLLKLHSELPEPDHQLSGN